MSKEYEIKTKMEWEQWLQLKMIFLFCYNLKVVIWGGGRGGGEVFLGEGMEWANFQLVEELPPSSPVGKTLLDVNKDSGTK